MKLPTPEKSTMCGYRSLTSAGGMPMARQPSTTLRSPVRSSSNAAFTPRSAAWPEVYTAPCSAGSSPAMAQQRGLARPVPADDPHHVTVVDDERDAADRVHFP